jgi:Peptidase family M1 domain
MRPALRKAVFGAFLLILPLFLGLPAAAQAVPPKETPAAFVERLQTLLRSGTLDGYLEAFRPDARPAERARMRLFFDDLKMTDVHLRPAGVQQDSDGLPRVFVQAFFENDYSAVIESWTLALEDRGGAWSVGRLDINGAMSRLYKIRVPGDRAVRARRVEVRHADIRFTFSDAAVFYDNIPNFDTALVVIGRGRVDFAPGDANEKHQLDLLYKKDRIDDEVDSLFIRCSPSLLESRITIETDPAGAAVTDLEQARAASVFSRNYPRSYTIESSLDGGLLSFLPQGDEAVFEFKARRAGELVYIYYPFSSDEISLYDHGRERAICLYSPSAADGAGGSPKRMFLSFAEKFDVSHYALDLSLVPSTSYLSAKARIEVVPKVDFLDSLKFRFSPDLEILKIADEAGRELFYTVDKVRRILYIYLLSPPSAGAPTTIEITYRGRMAPATPTTDVIGQAGAGDKIRIRPRYETAFYSHAGNWYPGPAEEDYFPARLTVMVPPEYRCIAVGELVAQGRREEMDDVAALEKAGSAVYTFVSQAPVKYLSFIVGKFVPKKDRLDPVPITLHVSSEILDSRPVLVDQAADILGFYSGTFGPYPYEKLGIVLRLWPVLGGHSPASFIVLNEVPWVGDSGFPMTIDTPVDLSGWDEYFLAHEIAHQWWGQGVSFDSYKDQWLSEGLAQFAAASYLRRRYGESAFSSILRKFARWTEKKSFRGPIIMGSRLSYFDFTAYQAIVYNKAALALFMLQDLVGREAFEAGLKAFFANHKYGAARTGEFFDAIEAASGRDLETFVQGWFYSWELPEVRTTWTETPVPEGVRIDVKATQVRGRFVFPLWVEWVRGRDSGRVLIAVDGPTASSSFVLPGRPDRIRINPDKAVPGKFY